jgi:hypothetical protein
MKVEFKESAGNLRFECESGNRVVSGIIPEKIVRGGITKIKRFVYEQSMVLVREKRDNEIRRSTLQRRIKKTHKKLSFRHRGSLLIGRILFYEGDDPRGCLTVHLDSPLKCADQEHILESFGMALADLKVWDDSGSLTPWAIAKSRDLMVQMYTRKKNEALASKLNQ